jgi:hypothetical protein
MNKKIIIVDDEEYPLNILTQIKFRLDNNMMDVTSNIAAVTIPLTFPLKGKGWLQVQLEALVPDYFDVGQSKVDVEIAEFHTVLNSLSDDIDRTAVRGHQAIQNLDRMSTFTLVVCFVIH